MAPSSNRKTGIALKVIRSPAYAQVPNGAIDAVRALQAHIIEDARTDAGALYTDINDWLSDESVTVDQEFADISLLAGYEIDAANIG